MFLQISIQIKPVHCYWELYLMSAFLIYKFSSLFFLSLHFICRRNWVICPAEFSTVKLLLTVTVWCHLTPSFSALFPEIGRWIWRRLDQTQVLFVFLSNELIDGYVFFHQEPITDWLSLYIVSSYGCLLPWSSNSLGVWQWSFYILPFHLLARVLI